MAHRLNLVILTPALAICRLPADADLPVWAADGPFTSLTRTSEELSIVCSQDGIPDELTCDRDWRCLRVAGRLDFALVGVLAVLTAPLADAGVSVFAISTFNTDYLLVKGRDLDRAAEALRQAGHEVRAE
ncbi:MAG: ACT domain-containing protein [Gemmataceae bacterium]